MWKPRARGTEKARKRLSSDRYLNWGGKEENKKNHEKGAQEQKKTGVKAGSITLQEKSVLKGP